MSKTKKNDELLHLSQQFDAILNLSSNLSLKLSLIMQKDYIKLQQPNQQANSEQIPMLLSPEQLSIHKTHTEAVTTKISKWIDDFEKKKPKFKYEANSTNQQIASLFTDSSILKHIFPGLNDNVSSTTTTSSTTTSSTSTSSSTTSSTQQPIAIDSKPFTISNFISPNSLRPRSTIVRKMKLGVNTPSKNVSELVLAPNQLNPQQSEITKKLSEPLFGNIFPCGTSEVWNTRCIFTMFEYQHALRGNFPDVVNFDLSPTTMVNRQIGSVLLLWDGSDVYNYFDMINQKNHKLLPPTIEKGDFSFYHGSPPHQERQEFEKGTSPAFNDWDDFPDQRPKNYTNFADKVKNGADDIVHLLLTPHGFKACDAIAFTNIGGKLYVFFIEFGSGKEHNKHNNLPDIDKLTEYIKKITGFTYGKDYQFGPSTPVKAVKKSKKTSKVVEPVESVPAKPVYMIYYHSWLHNPSTETITDPTWRILQSISPYRATPSQ